MSTQTKANKGAKVKIAPVKDWGEPLKKLSDKMGQLYIWDILAFILPFIFLGIGFAKKEIHPFGDQQILVTDLWHQYYPFFQILQEKLTHGESLLYTWRSGLGTNFLAMMSYYAASPLNLLSIFLPKAYLREGLTVILMLKFSFASFFMTGMLRYVFKRNDISILMFGVMYALCSYMMGYYWNIIWIDTVALLPLVMHGLVALVREGKYRLYVVALALSVISSYYIGYMVCIFVVISFFLICLYEGTGLKKFGKRFLLVTGTSVMGGGLAAWILLPAFFALQLTHSANNSFPKTISFYEAWRDVLSRMLAFTDPTSKEGLPNLYCGLLPVLLLGVFVIAKKIRLREKISGILLMAFLIVSCNMNVLNYIWHAFHFPNMLPYRFAFIFSFVMLVAGYRAFTVLLEEKLSIIQWIAMLLVGGVFCFLGYGSGIQEDDNHKFVMYSAILGGVYLVIIFLRMFAPKQLVQLALALALCFEMGSAAITGVKAVGSSGYSSYPSSNEEIQDMIKQSKKLDNELFYRTELTAWYTLNDPSLYYYDGVSQFSSMANEHMTTFMRLIGIPASEAGNRYYYANTSPLTNMLLDVQYVMAKDGYNADELTMHQITSSGVCTMYKNDYSLGLGFMTDPATRYLVLDETLNPFEQQNAIFKRITGLSDMLFQQIDITNVGHTGYDVTRREYGKYNYSRQEGASGDTFLKYNYTAVRDGVGYALMKVTDADNMDVYYDGYKIHRYNIGRQPYITPVVTCKAGETVTLRCDMDEEDRSGTIEVYFYQLNEEVLQKGYDILKQHTLQLDSFSDTKFSGTVTADRDGCFYLSVPYEEGWTMYVDGQKAELYPVFDAVCGTDLTAGTHTITMKYSPKGFVPGLIIAIVCAGIFVALIIIERKKGTKADPDDENAEKTDEDLEDEEPEEETAEKKTADEESKA